MRVCASPLTYIRPRKFGAAPTLVYYPKVIIDRSQSLPPVSQRLQPLPTCVCTFALLRDAVTDPLYGRRNGIGNTRAA